MVTLIAVTTPAETTAVAVARIPGAGGAAIVTTGGVVYWRPPEPGGIWITFSFMVAVAVAPLPPPPVMLRVARFVYSDPGLVTVTLPIPAVKKAVAVAPDPVVSPAAFVKITVGVDV